MEYTPINGETIRHSFYSGIKEPEIEKLYYQYFRQVNSCITCNKEKLGIGTNTGVLKLKNVTAKSVSVAYGKTATRS